VPRPRCGTPSTAPYPTTANAYQATFQGGDSTDARDATLSVLSPDGSALLYSTFLDVSGRVF